MGCASCREKRRRKQLPSAFAMARNLALTVANVLKYAAHTGQVKAEEEIIHQRTRTCKACNFLLGGKRCKLCGCYVVPKAGLKAEKCPDGRW